jgi:hypothetical protein
MTRLSQLAREHLDYYGTPLDDCPPSPPYTPLPTLDLDTSRQPATVRAVCPCGYRGERHGTVSAAVADRDEHGKVHR